MMKYIIAIAGILILAVNANAAFPVDEAGIAAYVNMNRSIDLIKAADVFAGPIVVNETYLIGQISGWSGKVYLGADGWVIAYVPNGSLSSNLIGWNEFAINPNVNNVTNMLEDSMRRVSETVGVNFSIIKPNIQYYNFEYPNATNMTVILETQTGNGLNEFYVLVPSNKTVYESSYNLYCNFYNYCPLILDRSNTLATTSSVTSYSLSTNFLHTIGLSTGITGKAGLSWVFIT